MLNNPAPVESSYDEGTVTEVDAYHFLCRVKTMKGKNLNSVSWQQPFGGASRGGDRGTPLLGDRVKIDSSSGAPIIVGFLPKLQNTDNTFPIEIDSGERAVDTGSFSPSSDTIIGDQNSPTDMVGGDRIISSHGGGMVAILRGGSLLFRSSRLAEIFISKWDDLVRVVSRNWEHFTDASSDVIKSIEGRVYRYTGYANTFAASKVGDYQYEQFIGDVGLAEASKDTYENTGATDQRIFKESVTTVMKREISLDGTHDIVSGAGPFTRVRTTASQVDVTFNDVNFVTVNADKIFLSKGGNPTITLDSSGVKAVFGGGTVTIDNAGVRAEFGGHFMRIDNGGVNFG